MSEMFRRVRYPNVRVFNDTPPYYIDKGTANVTYWAWENTASAQVIFRYDKTTSPRTVGFARGAWADRASLTYKDFGEFQATDTSAFV